MADKLQDISEYHERLITTVTSPFIEIAGSYPPPPDEPSVSRLFYGDNLDIMRHEIERETIDLCYIDPPFNSNRNYQQIYNNIGGEDRAIAQAFIDTWTWGEQAQKGFDEIITNQHGRFQPQTIELIKGLRGVLKKGSLLAYLVSMTLRLTEVYRVLKSTGTFYLHCDPTSSHYLKLVLDGIFCSREGEFLNEVIWCYSHGGKSKHHFGRKHDVIFVYAKSGTHLFNGDQVRIAMKSGKETFGGRLEKDTDGREYRLVYGTRNAEGKTKYYKYYLDEGKVPEDWWVDINSLQASAAERLGYPTQKPEALLERIIKASSNEGDLILDAYCGCGTSVAVAQRLNRQWIGIDITYQAIAVIMKRLEDQFGKPVSDAVQLSGAPRDMDSVRALINNPDDRVRKEFEKWAVLTYTNNQGMINETRGADGGIDGTVYFRTGPDENETMVFQVKSGRVTSADISKLIGDMGKAKMATLITLQTPTGPMRVKAKDAGSYRHPWSRTDYDKIQIVTIQQILNGKRLELPLSFEVLKKGAVGTAGAEQIILPVVA